MKNSVITYIIAAACLVAVVYIATMWWRRKQLANITQSNEENTRQLQLLLASLKNVKQPDQSEESRSTIHLEIKTQIVKLIEQYPSIEPKVTVELKSALALLEINQETKAIVALTKVIENLLKEIYKDNELLRRKHSKPVLANYLDFAKEVNLFNRDEHSLATALRDTRNEECHQVGLDKEKNLLKANIFTAISIIFKLCAEYQRMKMA